MRRFHVLFALLLAVLFVVTSCAEPQQPALEVTPATSTLVSLESTQLTVTRRFAGGGPVEQVTHQVTYSTSNRNVATVSNEGLVTAGDDPGTVVIRVYDPATTLSGRRRSPSALRASSRSTSCRRPRSCCGPARA